MALTIWTIYFNPTDYPNKFVARCFKNDEPTSHVFVCDKIEPIRKKLDSLGFVYLKRSPDDDPCIVETWI